MVKINVTITNLDPFVMVMMQGDRYISATGDIFLFTPFYEDMMPQGLVFPRRAHTEPPPVVPQPSGVHLG